MKKGIKVMVSYLNQLNKITEELVEEPGFVSDLKLRTKNFSWRCYDLCEMLSSNGINNNIRNQLFRCSSSVAANYRAASLAQSKASFIAKISIVIEEADESEFWLSLIFEKKVIDDKLVLELLKESRELTSIFKKSRLTAKMNMKKN